MSSNKCNSVTESSNAIKEDLTTNKTAKIAEMVKMVIATIVDDSFQNHVQQKTNHQNNDLLFEIEKMESSVNNEMKNTSVNEKNFKTESLGNKKPSLITANNSEDQQSKPIRVSGCALNTKNVVTESIYKCRSNEKEIATLDKEHEHSTQNIHNSILDPVSGGSDKDIRFASRVSNQKNIELRDEKTKIDITDQNNKNFGKAWAKKTKATKLLFFL